MSALADFRVAFPLLVAVRLALTQTALPDALKHSALLSSPLTSYSHLQEGIYLYNLGVNPYSGGVFHHSPLLLSLFTTVLPNSRWSAHLLWTAADVIAAWSLVTIWRRRQSMSQSSRDWIVAASYLLNPYLFLPSLALSSSSLENALALVALMFASRGKSSPAVLCLALLLQQSLSSILLIAPTLLLLLTSPTSRLASPHVLKLELRPLALLTAELACYTAFLTITSAVVAGGWMWVPQTWGVSLTLPDLTPNPGLWWYFFTEMFDHFRPFFLMVFSVHLLIYIAPICIKFQHDMLYAAFLLVGVLATFKAYPTLSDPGLYLSMHALFPEVYPHFRHPIVTALLHLHAALLMPMFHNLWLSQGTGNANFFYASTLVFACANGAALIEGVWAGLRIAIGPEKEGYSVSQE
ncbi:GPI transamidase subunit PIG-U [Schizophyllum fasciatum]